MQISDNSISLPGGNTALKCAPAGAKGKSFLYKQSLNIYTRPAVSHPPDTPGARGTVIKAAAVTPGLRNAAKKQKT